MLRLYRELLALRARAAPRGQQHFQVLALGPSALALRRPDPPGARCCWWSTSARELAVELAAAPAAAPPAGATGGCGWRREEARFGGAGERFALEGDGLRLGGPGAVVLVSREE